MKNKVLSPQGDRLLWVCVSDGLSTGSRVFQWLFSRSVLPTSVRGSRTPKRKRVVSIWISRRDGSDLHEIGEDEVDIMSDIAPQTVLWMPNGKRISFHADDCVWTVAAE